MSELENKISKLEDKINKLESEISNMFKKVKLSKNPIEVFYRD